MRKLIVSPSVLAADFSDIRGALSDVKESGTSWVHLDVMDGAFVPNISFGPKFIADSRKHSDLIFDTHLMVEEPIRYVKEFADAGSNYITIHVEACSDVVKTIDEIKALGCKVGLSFKPATPVKELEPYLDMVDLILVMSVNPGFGGQSLIPETLDKVRELVKLRGNRSYKISIDGGVNSSTISNVYDSGVDIIVAGSAFFKASDKKSFIDNMSQGLGK
ncbi:MAG: ribulose-phosphate 3-epimerase [Sphaerochaetaceae bacterium]|nr:ribulose-phosphate 3-epimerase [Sphaerochaetaceae bacterium]